VEVLKSLLIQILDANLNNPTVFQPVINICDSSTQPRATKDSEEALWSVLKEITQIISQKSVILVVDGVDEIFLDEQVEFVDNILSILNYDCRLPVQVKVFLTSRPQHAFKVFDYHPSINLCVLSSNQIIPDIEIYTRNAVKASSTLGALEIGLREDITSRLVNKSDGMFLWAKLMIHELEKQKSNYDIQTMLNRLPSGIREAFNRIIGNMEEGCSGDIIFQYLASAFRPLTLPELTELLETGLEDRDYNPQRKLLIPMEEYLQKACRGLVTCGDGNVQFVHESVKEYLCESRKLYSENSHSRMAAMTLTYGSFHRLDFRGDSEAALNDRFQRFKQAYPFLEYSILNWFRHAQMSRVQRRATMATIVVDALLRADHLTWMESRCFEECLSAKELIARQSEVLQVRREFKGTHDQETIKTTLEVGTLLQQHGHVKASQELLTRMLAELNDNSLNNDLRLATMKAIARSFERQNDWEQAEAQYRLCLDYCGRVQNSGDMEAVILGNSLGWALKGQGKVKEAKEVYEQTYLKARESCAPGHRDTLLAATELAYIHEIEGSEEQAYQILKQELDVASCASGVASILTYRASLGLLEFFERRGRWHEAEALARTIFLSTQHGEASCVDVAIKLTTYLERRGSSQEGEDILLSVCSSLKAAEAVRHRELLRVSLALASLYQRKTEFTKAEKVYDMCRIALGYLGPETVLMVDSKLAECLEMSQRLPEAQAVYERVFETSQAKFGLDSRKSIDASNKLATFYEKNGKLEDALAVYSHVYDFCVERLGQDHRYTIAILASIAGFYKRTGNSEAAGQSSMELFRIWTRTRGVHYHKALEMMEEV
jgi:tetratricopeptide (TPR) repeat protein